MAQGGRYVVFDVAGTITLSSDISVNGAFITIDGAAAPVPGITLAGAGLVIRGSRGARDVVVTGLRIRNAAADGVAIGGGAANVVLDHLSIHGSALRNVSVDNSADVTVCWSVLSTPVNNNVVIKNNAARVSLHNNVLHGATYANPTVLIDDAGTPATATTLDMRNNVVWRWNAGFGTLIYKGAAANVVANLYSDPGAQIGSQDNALLVCSGDCTGTPASDGRAFAQGNVSGDNLPVDINAEGTEPGPFPAPAFATEPACGILAPIVGGAGPRPLDAIDSQALNELVQPNACRFDLLVDDVAVPATATVGLPFGVTASVRNAGPAAGVPTTTSFYISTTPALSGAATLIGTQEVPALAVAETHSAPVSLTLPAGIGAACTYYVIAQANAGGADEIDTTNNVRASGPVKVCPDLLVDVLTAPDAAMPGAQISVGDTVRNRGQTASGAWTMTFYLATQPALDASAVLLGSRAVPALEPGATSSATTTLTLPATAGAASTYYLLAIVDPEAIFGEYDETNNLKWVKVKIGPDLVAGSVSVPPSAVAGATVSVSETTRNRGISPSPPTITRIYFSASATFDATATPLGSRNVPALEAGASSTEATTVTIPSSAGGSGSYYLHVVADADNQVNEPDETNNVTTVPLRVGPDLHISAVSAPATAVAGGSIAVDDITRNRGVGPAAASATRFYLSTAATFDPATAILLGSRPVPALDAGATHAATTPLPIPTSAGAAGTYYLFAVADGDGQVVETDEANNASYAVVRIGPDLHISAVSAPATAVAGGSIAVDDTTRNRGVSPAAASATRFYLSTAATLDPATAIPLGSRPVPALDAGATHTATTPLPIPASAGAAGTYYLFAVADGDGRIVETDEANNASYAVVKIGPDLHISAVSAPATAVAGGSIAVDDTTRNRGVGPAAASVTKFYLSTAATFDAATATLLGSRPVPALDAGATHAATTPLPIPASAGATGTYYLFAVADGDGQIVETSETNNASYAVVKIGPDLVAQGLSAPEVAAAGTTITVTETTRNRGVGPAAASSTRIYLSTATTLDASAVLLASRAVVALEAGGTSTAATSVTIPASAGTAGNYYLLVVADGAGQVVETDETNNVTPWPIRIGPDLTVTGVNGPGTAGFGEAIAVVDVTKNKGVSPSPASTTRFYLSRTTTVDAAAVLIGSRAIPALGIGETSSGSTAVTVPATLAGNLFLLAVVNAEGAVAETDTGNNTASVPIMVGPDYTGSAVNGPSSASPGQTITVYDSTRNRGYGTAPPSTTRYYLSSTATLGPSAVLIGSRSVPALGAGATHTGSGPATLPPGMAGALFLLAVANGDSAVPELDAGNNTIAAPINVGPDLTITGITGPTRGGPEAPITVTDSTKNRGVAAASATITGFYLSPTPAVAAGAILLGHRAVPPLEAGATSTGSTVLTLPTGLAGTFYIVAVADTAGELGELDETNNSAAEPITIGPDLFVTGISAPTTANPGSVIAVTDGTKNKGVSAAGASATRFYLSRTPALGADAVLLGSRGVPALAPGDTSTVTTSLTIPASSPGGTYYLVAVADGAGQNVELDEANNATSTIIRLGTDLTVSWVGAPEAAVAGTTIQVTETTRNRGAAPAAASVTRFYLSTQLVLEATASLIGSRGVPALEPGATHTAITSVAIPAGAGAAGSYYILAVADGEGVLAETDETNNVAAWPIKIGPDLTVTGLAAPDAAVAGTTIQVTETTRNRGVAPAAASLTRFYLSTQPAVDATAVLLGSRAVPALASGGTHTATTGVTVPASVGAAGSYYLLVVADGAGALAETDETNNVAAWPIKIGPDLTVTGLSGPTQVAGGYYASIYETTRNRGAAPAAGSVTRYYFSTRKTLDTTAVLLASRAIPPLAAGAQSAVTMSLLIPEVERGTYYVLVVADAGGTIVETSETNNLKYLAVLVE